MRREASTGLHGEYRKWERVRLKSNQLPRVTPALSKVCVMMEIGLSASFSSELLWKAPRSCWSDWLVELELELVSELELEPDPRLTEE
jgi:hypothetical protein